MCLCCSHMASMIQLTWRTWLNFFGQRNKLHIFLQSGTVCYFVELYATFKTVSNINRMISIYNRTHDVFVKVHVPFYLVSYNFTKICKYRLSLMKIIFEPRHDKTNKMCPGRRLRSAWASAQSDQSLRCPHEESLSP